MFNLRSILAKIYEFENCQFGQFYAGFENFIYDAGA